MQLDDPFQRSRFYLFILWITAVIFVITGVYLSHIAFLQTEWLSRAGCAIVILGILSSLGVIIYERLLAIGLRMRRRRAIQKITSEKSYTANDVSSQQHEIEHINQMFDKRRSDMTQKLKMSFGVLEVSLLITGTFLWGFGDLLIRLL